jgi:hypothetical protein
MCRTTTIRATRQGFLVLAFIAATQGAGAQDVQATRDQILQLQRQNEQMRQQLEQQQRLIDALSAKVSQMQENSASNAPVTTGTSNSQTEPEEAPAPEKNFRFGKVDISGEGALAFFDSQPAGQTPNPTFQVNEARIFLDAPVWDQVYFFSEVNFATPEDTDLTIRFGELYLDFESISRLWDVDHLVNLRVGRFYIPFGEEYQSRYAIDNPLISRSLSDLWGEDNGLELYGSLGRLSYAVAVQNGTVQPDYDFTADKSVAGRIGYDPADWLHLSVSGMRTGDISAQGDVLSGTWFANGFFRSLGSTNTTKFHANLAEADARATFSPVQLKVAGGYIGYADNDPGGNNHRDVYYYYVEGKDDLTRHLYAAARMSEVFAHNGFPIVGNGNMDEYLFDELTSQYWRLSLGLGYRFNGNLVIKGEYSFNRGRELDGTPRDQEDMFAFETAFQF